RFVLKTGQRLFCQVGSEMTQVGRNVLYAGVDRQGDLFAMMTDHKVNRWTATAGRPGNAWEVVEEYATWLGSDGQGELFVLRKNRQLDRWLAPGWRTVGEDVLAATIDQEGQLVVRTAEGQLNRRMGTRWVAAGRLS